MAAVAKSMDVKLARILADPGCGQFVLADAKDADMAFGIASTGRGPEHYGAGEGRFRTLPEYHEQIRSVARQGLVDIVLMSAYTNSLLTIQERLFDGSHVTPAARGNDTTDIHVIRHGVYPSQPSRPFRTTTIDHVQCGQVDCDDTKRALGADLVLYSVTFNNDVEADLRTLEAYKAFRVEAEAKGMRHFLEVFDPNAPATPVEAERVGAFINDHITRMLAGVAVASRPVFLKIVYHGPKFMEELVRYDPRTIVGILGGSAGTTYDAYKMLSEAKKHGARVALYGRKINNAEHQLAFIECLRRVADGDLSAEEAVRAYHGILEGLGIQPYRSLDEDMQLTSSAMSYAGGARTGRPIISVPRHTSRPAAASTPPARRTPRPPPAPAAPPACPVDFSTMTSEQRLAYFRQRFNQL